MNINNIKEESLYYPNNIYIQNTIYKLHILLIKIY
jgi:hypothetical protein